MKPDPMRMLYFRMTSGVTGSLFVTTLKLSLKVRIEDSIPVSNCQKVKKKSEFFCLFLFEGTFTSFFED